MKYLVLDTRGGARRADLFIIEPGARRPAQRLRLGYVPELRQDPATGEVLVVETELPREDPGPTHYWLKRFEPSSFRPLGQVQTPARPMYTSFPGRSHRVRPSLSGRYIYILGIGCHPDRMDIYRTTVHRYDRRTDALEAGAPIVDSCMVEFGPCGPTDDDLYFHLSCEFPSTVAYGRFDREAIRLVPLREAASRTCDSGETCGSWFDQSSGDLYCVSGDGVVYRTHAPLPPEVFARLPLSTPACVPLHAIQGANGKLFVAVSTSQRERGLGLASELRTISLADGSIGGPVKLPVPVLNFVVDPEGCRLIGVNPYLRRLLVVDLESGETVQSVEDLGETPAEVLLLTDGGAGSRNGH